MPLKMRHFHVCPRPLDKRSRFLAFIDLLLDLPGVEIRDCGKEWPLLRGNLVTDAWIASAVQTVGEHLVSFDNHFKPFLFHPQFFQTLRDSFCYRPRRLVSEVDPEP